MAPETRYLLTADAILLLHACIVVFVIASLPLIIIGGIRGWHWVRNAGFRWLHLLAIGVVVLQAWLGRLCPLTTLEMHYRRLAGDPTYEGSFIAHWISALLYYDAPLWLFGLLYSAFAVLVIFAWHRIRPRSFRPS